MLSIQNNRSTKKKIATDPEPYNQSRERCHRRVNTKNNKRYDYDSTNKQK